MLRPVRLVLAILASVVLVAPGCQRGPDQPRDPGPMRVVVSIPPLEGMVRAVVPGDAEVRVLVEPGRSPHGFEPTPSDIAAIGEADLVVLVGMGIESFLPASVRTGDRVITMADALGIEADDHAGHDHGGHDHAHGEGDADPHLWLDPVLVRDFAAPLTKRVWDLQRAVGVSDGPRDETAGAGVALYDMADAVDAAYVRALADLKGAAIITQHAGWSRLTERYGLEIAGVIQPDDHGEPSPGHIAEVVGAAREHNAVAVFGEVQLDARLAERVAGQLGLRVGRLDPLGRGDWEAMMLANLEELVGTITDTRPDDNSEEPGG